MTLLSEPAAPASAARPSAGDAMYGFVRDLYPLCRSITGDGLRATLKAIQREIPLAIHEVPTGTRVLDWTVPLEWNVRDAWVASAAGERVIDFGRSNLHVVGYSAPVRARLSLAALRPRLHSLPDRPDWIPYRTSYYVESWGFCLAHRDLARLEDGEYEVCVDATLEPGHLSYGELALPGERDDEVLVSCHCCHPSLCNDNLSGIAVATFLARHLADRRRRYTYRFLFVPGTIGAITWLALNRHRAGRIAHGLVATCLGDGGGFTYKRSRRGDAEIDRAVAVALRDAGAEHEIVDFSPYGYDERQYCSPGFNLPVGSLSRSSHGRFPEYHTSADDLTLVRPAHLAESLERYLDVVSVLEGNRRFVNLSPFGEPQLGRRGLYRAPPGQVPGRHDELAMLWVLNLSDGAHALLDVAERARLPFSTIERAASALRGAALLEEATDP